MHLINALKSANQDHEFYPTTAEIIAALLRDLRKKFASIEADRWERRHKDLPPVTILDIGAGNGKVLDAVHAADIGFERFEAIEKSPILQEHLHQRVFIIGSDFMEQTLITKRADVIFCNPPYSVFTEWMVKIIRESSAPCVYLVVPRRWQDSIPVADAIKFREAKVFTLGDYDFQDAEDRAARAKVHLLRIDIPNKGCDAFDRFFAETFPELEAKFSADTEAKADATRTKEQHEQEASRFSSLVPGESYPEAIVGMYQEEMARLQRNYTAVCTLDVALLREFGLTIATIKSTLRSKLDGLRMEYWTEVFGRIAAITDRLTSRRRAGLLESLGKNTHVDFTVGNILAVCIWVIKQANSHLDGQLCEVFEQMVDKANITGYKSNQRVFQFDAWRYRQRRHEMKDDECPERFKLEYRLVLHWMGGIDRSYSGERLAETACNFLADLKTIARNLGFIPTDLHSHDQRLDRWSGCWKGGRKEEFHCHNTRTKKREVLFEVRAFLNRNIHIRLNQDFALALNVEYGRIKGWLKEKRHAADEMNEPRAAEFFGILQPILASALPMLAAPQAEELPAISEPPPTTEESPVVVKESLTVETLAAEYNQHLANGSAAYGPEMMQRKGALGAAIDPDIRLGDQQTLGEVYAMHLRGECTAEEFTRTHHDIRSRLTSLAGIPPKFTLTAVENLRESAQSADNNNEERHHATCPKCNNMRQMGIGFGGCCTNEEPSTNNQEPSTDMRFNPLAPDQTTEPAPAAKPKRTRKKPTEHPEACPPPFETEPPPAIPQPASRITHHSAAIRRIPAATFAALSGNDGKTEQTAFADWVDAGAHTGDWRALYKQFRSQPATEHVTPTPPPAAPEPPAPSNIIPFTPAAPEHPAIAAMRARFKASQNQ